MGKLSKREKVLLTLLVVALAGFLYYNFVLKDFIENYIDIGTQIKETELKINDLRLKKSSIEMVEGKIENLKKEYEPDFKKVMDYIDRPQIILTLDEVISPFTSSVNYQFPKEYISLQDNYIATVEISFKSTIKDYSKILSLLKDADYINKITNTTVSSLNEDTGTNDIRMQVQFLTKDVYPKTLAE